MRVLTVGIPPAGLETAVRKIAEKAKEEIARVNLHNLSNLDKYLYRRECIQFDEFIRYWHISKYYPIR